MKKVQINLLDLHKKEINQPPYEPAQKRLFPSLVGLTSLLLVVLGATSVFSYQQSRDENSRLNKTLDSLFTGKISQFVELPDRKLEGESDDRINVLLLGIGGKSHDGPYLSDTNIVLSIQPSTNRVSLISIPRDLLVPLDNYGWRKINNANAFAEMDNPGHGAQAARDVVSKVLNISIPYYLRVDFSGFVKIVDILGGLPITVDQSFTDYSYPTENYKYQTITFKQGFEVMDGQRALKFVRSRHSGMNNEGSDFARSRRQQKIIVAVKEKLFSADFLLNPQKISEVFNALRENISTNISTWEVIRFASLAKAVDQTKVSQLVFDDGPEGHLVSGIVDGAYVLQPRDGTFEEMQLAVKNVFTEQKDTLRVVVLNGTNETGLATRIGSQLEKSGFKLVSVGNAEQRDQAQTIIYPLSATEEGDTLVKQVVGSNLQKEIPPALKTTAEADYIIVLGADIASRQSSK